MIRRGRIGRAYRNMFERKYRFHRANQFANTEPRPVSTSLAVAKQAEASEGPERDGNKPLMQNRSADESRTPTGSTASDTFPGNGGLSGGVETAEGHASLESASASAKRIDKDQEQLMSNSGSSAPPAQLSPDQSEFTSLLSSPAYEARAERSAQMQMAENA